LIDDAWMTIGYSAWIPMQLRIQTLIQIWKQNLHRTHGSDSTGSPSLEKRLMRPDRADGT
jgi:hypothetical protein